jgi:hypothetical protein
MNRGIVFVMGGYLRMGAEIYRLLLCRKIRTTEWSFYPLNTNFGRVSDFISHRFLLIGFSQEI